MNDPSAASPLSDSDTGVASASRDAAAGVPRAGEVPAPVAPAAAAGLSQAAPELTRTLLAILALGALIAGSFWVLRPFVPGLIWATTIVIATWPLMITVQRLLWGRRWLAVVVMTLAQLLLFFVPLSLAIATVVDNVDVVVGWVRML
jgi:hypothetical protein